MDDAVDMMDHVNGHYGSQYAPKGSLHIRSKKLYEHTGEWHGKKGVWDGVHLAWEDMTLTIEGAQRIGSTATENVVDISQSQVREYLKGDDIDIASPEGPIIIRASGLYMAPATGTSSGIKNTLSKSRICKK